MTGDYISAQLRAKAAAMRAAPAVPTLSQLLTVSALSAGQSPKAAAADKAARQAAATLAQNRAFAGWEELRVRIPESREGLVLRELLDTHKPYLDQAYGYLRGPVCEHCDQIGGYDRDGVDWPCDNYQTIREGMT